MSMLGGPQVSGSAEVGEAVATFPEYEAAQKAVSKLIAAEVAARDIAIVGSGLRSIERVTGKLGYATAARSGAINGVLIGLFFAAILVLGSPSVPIQAFVGVLFVGIAVGMLLSIITYSFVRRRRDYASVVQVDGRPLRGDGRLAQHPSRPGDPRTRSGGRSTVVVAPQGPVPPVVAPRAVSPAAPDERLEPPRYGERVAPDAAPAGAPEGAGPGDTEADAAEGAQSRDR